MNNYIIPLFSIFVGILLLYRNLMFLLNTTKLEDHLKNNLTAQKWVAKYGFEKTLVMSKSIFIPIRAFMCVGIIVYGIWMLLKI